MKYSKEEKYACSLIFVYNFTLAFSGKDVARAKLSHWVEKLDKRYKIDGMKWMLNNPDKVIEIRDAMATAIGLESDKDGREKGI